MMLRKVPRAIRLGLTAGFLAAAASACTVAQRAEALYIYQHRLLAALTYVINVVEPDDPDLADSLYDSEDELNSACRALWEAGARRLSRAPSPRYCTHRKPPKEVGTSWAKQRPPLRGSSNPIYMSRLMSRRFN